MSSSFQDFGSQGAVPEGAGFQGYVLLECLRSGATEEVYRARQTASGRSVLLKILPAGPDRATLDSWLDEARKAIPLRHECLVPVLDAGIHEGRFYYAAEFMSGGSILESIRSHGHLKEKHVVLLAQGISLGLQSAWDTARLLHGHLRPESVLLGPDGSVRVSDIGLGRVFCSRTAPGPVGLPFLSGQVHYLAPELARGDSDPDFRADVFSLGAVLYHAVTGVRPFDSAPEGRAPEALLREGLDPVCGLRPNVSRGMAWLIEKLMARDPAHRAASWAEVMADLLEVENGGLPYGKRPGPGESIVGSSAGKEPKAVRPAARAHGAGKAPRARVVLPVVARNRGSSFRSEERVAPAAIIAAAVIAVGLVVWVYRQYIAPRPPAAPAETVWTPPTAPAPSSPAPEPADVEEDLTPEEALRRLQSELAEMREASVPEGPDAGPSLEPGGARETSSRPAQFRRHSLFARAASSFNAALALYRRFQVNPAQTAELRQVEKLSEEALADFEALCVIYPGDAQVISRYVDQCYGMSRYARQSLLMSGASLSEGTAPSRRTPVKPPPRTYQVQRKERTLALAQNWRTGNNPTGPAVAELFELLGTRGFPRVDLAPKPSIYFLNRFSYLESADEMSLRVFRRKLPEPRPVLNPAFPNSSIRSVEMAGKFEDGYTRLHLLIDTRGQIVAVQLINEDEAETAGLSVALFSKDWKTFDLLALRSAENPEAMVAHRVRSGGGIVRIDSELALRGAAGSGAMGRSLARSSLLLPQPIVDLMLIRLGSSQ